MVGGDQAVGRPGTGAADVAAGENREIGAQPTLPEGPARQGSAPEESCWARFFGPADVVQLFRAVLCTLRRRMEREERRLPTPGEALGVMLDHVLSSWGPRMASWLRATR